MKRAIAAAEMVMILPAALFMTALFVRNLQPQPAEPAHTAQQIVVWYSAHPPFGLWVLLITLPFAVLVSGCATLLRIWTADAALRDTARRTVALVRAHLATLFVAAATLTAAVVLAIVTLHVLTD